MIKKMSMLFMIVWGLTIVPMQVWAAEDLTGWRCSKEVKLSGSSKYKAVMLDEDVYRNASPDLSDLRVVNNKGEAVAFYLQSSTPYENRKSTTYKTQITDRFSDRNDSYTDFKVLPLQENSDVLATSLSFSIPQAGFAKQIDLLGSHDGVQWQRILSDNIYRVDSLTKTTVQLNNTLKYRYYRIKVPNNLENVSIDKLDAVYETVQKDYESYIRTAGLAYEVQQKDKTTLLIVHNKDRLSINEMQLDTEGVFNRSYAVYTAQGAEEASYGITGDIYSLDFKDVKLNKTGIDFSKKPITAEYIHVKINNKDDKPIAIKGINTKFLLHKLVFEAKAREEYKLFFGNEKAARPSYDINSFLSHIEAEGQDISTLANFQEYAQNTESKKNTPNTSLIFNGVLVVAAGFLIFIIARKLNSKS